MNNKCLSAEYIGFWPFNDLYGGKDIAADHNNAIMENLNCTDGPFVGGGKAFTFSGEQNSFIRIPQSPILSLNGSFTFLIFVTPTSKTGPVLVYDVIGEQPLIIYFKLEWNELFFASNGQRRKVILNVQKDKWYFMGISYNITTQTLTAWMDGDVVDQ